MIVRDKVFVVTGAGNGIGREIARVLLNKGARVAAVDLDAAALQESADLAGRFADRISTHALDVTDKSAVTQLPAAVIQAHGVVDGVINVAGVIHSFTRVNDLPFNEIDRVIAVNFYGVLNITKTFLPHLLQRPEAHIAAVSSMGGFVPVPGQTIYGASKAAVKLLMEGLHSELLDTNVGVSVVFPGAIATNIAVNSGAMTQQESDEQAKRLKMTPPAVAAETIVRGIEKKSYHVFVGSDSSMLDKLCRLMPLRTAKIVYARMRELLPAQ